MAERTLEERVTTLEENKDEWNATLRVRVKGFSKLEERCVDLSRTSKEYWRLKSELLELLLFTLQPMLAGMFKDGGDVKVHREFSECFGQADFFLGIFPVGGRFGERKALDIRFRPGLNAWRTNALVKFVLSPALKKSEGGVEMWVPLSAPEQARRQKRRAQSTDAAPNSRRRTR